MPKRKTPGRGGRGHRGRGGQGGEAEAASSRRGRERARHTTHQPSSRPCQLTVPLRGRDGQLRQLREAAQLGQGLAVQAAL